MGKLSLRYFGPVVWEIMLPDVYKTIAELDKFKEDIKEWIPDCKCRLCKTYIPRLGFIETKWSFVDFHRTHFQVRAMRLIYDQPCHSWGSKSSIFLFPTYPYPHDIHTLPIIHGGQFYSEFSLQFGTNIFVSLLFLGVLSARLFSTFSTNQPSILVNMLAFVFEAYIFCCQHMIGEIIIIIIIII